MRGADKMRRAPSILKASFFFFSVAILICPSLVNALSTDQTNVFNSGIDYYDVAAGSDSGSCSSLNLTGSDNEEKTWNYFKGKGLTDQQVAGIMGNIEVESAFNPEIMQKGGTSQNPADADPLGWGLIQWTPGSKVIDMAKEAGVTTPIYLLGSQLDLVWQHMHNNPVVTQPFSMSDFTNIQDEKQAAIYFRDHIEGGADANGIRETDASAILAKYGGSSSGGGGSTCAGAGSGSCKLSYKAEYSQQQLAKIFGNPGTADSHPDLHLQTVSFMNFSVQVSPLIAPCLNAVEQQIQAANLKYKITSVGCYRFDSNNGSSNIGLSSYHTYGAACDINPYTNNFYDTGPVPYNPNCPPAKGVVDSGHCYDMSPQLIKIFADNGFYWGGNFNSVKDYMHFEWHGVVP